MCLYIPFYIIALLSFNYSTTRYNFVNLKETRKISHLEELVGGHLPPSSSQRLTSTCMLWYPMSKNIFPLHLELHGCVILHSAVGVGQYNTSMQFKVHRENIVKCSWKTGCARKTCKCVRSKVLCNSRCQNSNACQNK